MRKKFHCGDKFCHVCNSPLQVHENWINYNKKMKPIWAKEKKLDAENKPSFWEKIKRCFGIEKNY